jgi:NitT/TauT family transport system substrate-binding protein
MKHVLLAALLAFATPAAADTIHMGETPYLSGGGFFLAKAKGYFGKLGLDIDTKIFIDGAMAVPGLVSGELDLTAVTASAGLFNSIAKGAPMVIFLDRGSNAHGHGITLITASPAMVAAGLTSLKEFALLKGKKIGVGALGSINQYEAGIALQRAGLDPVKDVTWTSNVSQPDLVKMQGRDLLDAEDLAYQFGVFAEQQNMGKIVATFRDLTPDTQVGMYAVRKDYLAAHRDNVIRYAMAYIQGARDFNQVAEHPDQHPAELQMLADAVASGKADFIKGFAPYWGWAAEDGAPNIASILAQQDFWVDVFHTVPTKIKEAEMFDPSIAREATERLTREHPFGG